MQRRTGLRAAGDGILRFGTLAVMAWLSAAPLAARAGDIPPACLARCGAASRDLLASPPPVQACLIRCRAGQEFDRSQRQGGAAQAASQAAPRTRSLAGSVPAATGPAAAASGRAPAGRERWGAIYTATPPNPAFGISLGQQDRLMTHARAESECSGRARAGCRMLSEFSATCAAAAQATRSLTLMPSEDPGTTRVTFVAGGSGPTRQEAEQAALAACGERDRSARCRIVASACGAG